MITNIDLKLSGQEPISREELFELVSSWGKKDSMNHSYIHLKPKECYDLSNLDVSNISDFSSVFRCSLYNGDLSKWDVSNATTMESMFSHSNFNNNLDFWDISNVTIMNFMFYRSKFNNDSLNNWNVSNVKFMNSTFESSIFNGNISNWMFNFDVHCVDLFWFNKNFENKYNNYTMIARGTKEFLEWFEKNRDKMREMNIPKEEILDFFSFDKNLELDLNKI